MIDGWVVCVTRVIEFGVAGLRRCKNILCFSQECMHYLTACGLLPGANT